LQNLPEVSFLRKKQYRRNLILQKSKNNDKIQPHDQKIDYPAVYNPGIL
jgi:hypothetical protein